jgi:hypothetical protein
LSENGVASHCPFSFLEIMKAINGFWDVPRPETATGAGFKSGSSVNESFTNKIMSKGLLGSGDFYFGPPPSITDKIKELKSGGFEFEPSSSVPTEI